MRKAPRPTRCSRSLGQRSKGSAPQGNTICAIVLLAIASALYTTICLVLSSIDIPSALIEQRIGASTHDAPAVPRGTIGLLTVENLGIKTPVMQPGADTPRTGTSITMHGETPRCSGAHTSMPDVISMGRTFWSMGTGEAGAAASFEALSPAYDPDAFADIGRAVIELTDGTHMEFKPIGAMRVDQSYQAIQRLGFEDSGDVLSWLLAMRSDQSVTDSAWTDIPSDPTKNSYARDLLRTPARAKGAHHSSSSPRPRRCPPHHQAGL